MTRKVVGVFVDIARMYHSVNLIDKRSRINYEKYLKMAVGDNELHRAYAYGVQIEDEAYSFIQALKGLGYETKYRQAKMIKWDSLEKENLRLRRENQIFREMFDRVGDENDSEVLRSDLERKLEANIPELPEYKASIKDTSWNVGITLDVVRNIRNLDCIVIGSNDPELVPLVQWVKEQGRIVTIFSFSIHRELRAIADHCKEIPKELLDTRDQES